MPYAMLGTQILHGVDPSDGTKWVVSRDDFDGFSSPASSVAVAGKPRAHGAWAGEGYLEARRVTAGGLIEAPSAAVLDGAIYRLHAACSLSLTTLTVEADGGTWYVNAKREGAVLVKKLSPTIASWSIQMVAPDPRRFASTLTGTTRLPASSGGLRVPFMLPARIDSAVQRGQVSLTNEGNIAGPVQLRIDGPVTGPVVTHVSSGRSLVFASTVTLGAGEWIDVDMEARTVLANGQASRNGWVTSRGWSQFEPGVNTWAFTAAVYDPGSTLTVSASPSWM